MYSNVICGTDKIEEELTQTSTRPIRILCHINESTTKSMIEKFDIVLSVEEDCLKTVTAEGNLNEWYEKLNHADSKYRKNIKKA